MRSTRNRPTLGVQAKLWAHLILASLLASTSPTLGWSQQTDSPQASLQGGPEPRKPGERGIGGWLPRLDSLRPQDLRDQAVSLDEWIAGRVSVFAMTSTSCPASRRYHATLRDLVNSPDYAEVAWVIVAPIETDSRDELLEFQQSLSGRALVLPDPQGVLAQAVGCLTTTDTTLIDATRTVRYRGAIDDQFGVGYALEKPRRRFLVDAIQATINSQPLAISATHAPGCTLDAPPESPALTEAATDAEITYHGQISRLLLKSCVECHRKGGVAPFALTDYREVIAHASMIREVVDAEIMPPWFAAEEPQGSKPAWANDRSLSAEEKRVLLKWLEGARLEGDPQDSPPQPDFVGNWSIGEPDAIYAFSAPVPVQATGTMPYRWVTVDTGLEETRWVQSIEVLPGAREVVHHVLVFVEDPADEAAGQRAVRDERGGFWAAYVPGNSSLTYPQGLAKRLPAGARLRFQMHYTPNGKATEDVTRLGVIFADGPPQYEVKVHGISNHRLSIPPGAANHREEATLRVPFDVRLIGFMPHMHVRGKACQYELESSDGSQMLLEVPRYDFNWQLLYRPLEPISVNAGQTLRFTAWYDNSPGNPANPDPAREVRWGQQTEDEMHLGYVEYILVDPSGDSSIRPARGGAAGVDAIFQRLDQNGDDALDAKELERIGEAVPRLKERSRLLQTLLNRADRDADERLSLDEFKAAAAALRSTQD